MLARLLEAVDDGKLRQVLQLIEASGRRRTLEPALAAMRPRLRQLRPKRPLTLPRLLTVPFEAALERGPDRDWPFLISRARLADWHQLMIEGLDQATRAATEAAIRGAAADDHASILEAGRIAWPQAARLLAGRAPGPSSLDDRAAAEADRCRTADLLAIGVDLVSLRGRLPARLTDFDQDEQATIESILALAEAGPADRLGLVTLMLLRAALRPATLAEQLMELAAPSTRPRLRPLLDQLLRYHQAGLDRQVTELAKVPERPLEELAHALSRLADTLVGPDGRHAGEAATDAETTALRQRAAAIAQERYTASITGLTAALPAAAGTARVTAVKAREAAARDLARLGRAARRLAPQAPIQQITDAALRRVVDLDPLANGETLPVCIDDARLVEILAGSDVAWQLLRPTTTSR